MIQSADGSCGNVVFCKQEERGSVFARLRRDKAYLYPLRLSRRNAMEPDEASAARREIGRETPPSVVFCEMSVYPYKILYYFVLTNHSSDAKFIEIAILRISRKKSYAQ